MAIKEVSFRISLVAYQGIDLFQNLLHMVQVLHVRGHAWFFFSLHHVFFMVIKYI